MGAGAESSTEDGSRRPRRRRILVIDDDVMHLRLVERILGDHEVMAVVQGSLGLELAGTQRPDLLVLDPSLPDIPGEAILRRLRERPATVDMPVIVVSGDGSRGEGRRLLGIGASAYLTKPLDVSQFVRTVNEVLDGRVSETTAHICAFCGRSTEPGEYFLQVVLSLHVAGYDGEIVQPPTVVNAGVFCGKPCTEGGAAETIAAGLTDRRVEHCVKTRQPGVG